MNTISSNTIWTSFHGHHLFATGAPADVALAVHRALRDDPKATIVIFDDRTGRSVDFDRRGTDEEIAARLRPPETWPDTSPPRRAGRPKLGVVAKEVTLLPRHWDWLEQQPGSTSAVLRRLIDEARKGDPERETVRQAQTAADRFMQALLGDQAGYEDAARALYQGDKEAFMALTRGWPADPRDHARHLAAPAFAGGGA